MKIVFFLRVIILCFPLNNLYAQADSVSHIQAHPVKNTYVLYGTIKDALTGNALTAATILISDLNKGVIAGEQGKYSLKVNKPGRYLIEVQYQGYASIAEFVLIHNETQKDFSLKPSVIEQEAVIVTGVSSATRIKQSPQTVDVVQKEDLMILSATNLVDALSKTIPGVNAFSTGPAIAKPFIRGLGYNRVITIHDGVKQEGQQWGDEHGLEVDEYSIQKVEVLKGPASLMYGSDAIAGVVNVITRVPVSNDLFKLNVSAEYQTNSNLHGFHAGLAGAKNNFYWNGYGSYKASQDYQNTYDGSVYNSRFKNKNAGLQVGYDGLWGYSSLSISSFDQYAGIIEGARDSASGKFIKTTPGGGTEIVDNNDFKSIHPDIPFQHIQHFKAVSNNNFIVGRSRIDLLLAYQKNSRSEFGEAGEQIMPSLKMDLETVNYNLIFKFPGSVIWHTSAGLNGMYQQNENGADEKIIPNYNLFDIGGFLVTQFIKNKVALSGGLRLDNRSIEGFGINDSTNKFTNFKRDFINASGSAGISYSASDLVTLKLNIARGFRAPNISELASNGAHEGTFRYEIGNQDLHSETSLQVDGSLEITSPHLSIEANLFYTHLNNFIFYEKVPGFSGDSIIFDAEENEYLRVFKFNQVSAKMFGGELSIDIHPHPLDWFHFKNTFSFTKGIFANTIDGSDNMPLIPPARFFSDLSFTLIEKSKTFRKMYVSVESDYIFNQNNPFRSYNTETSTAGYCLVNFLSGTEFVKKDKVIFGLTFSAQNLGNISYQSHLSRLKYTELNQATNRTGTFNMGRNFTLKIYVPIVYKI